MEDSAPWRSVSPDVSRDALGQASHPALQDQSMVQSRYLAAADLRLEDGDPDCIEFDMVEEAKHRVYFGVFQLGWLDGSNQDVRQRNVINFESIKETGELRSDEHKNFDLSPIETVTPANAWRTNMGGFDRAAQTQKSESKHGLRETTNLMELSVGTDLRHVCSLYGQPQRLASSFREDTSRFPSPGYGSIHVKRLEIQDDITSDSARLKVSFIN